MFGKLSIAVLAAAAFSGAVQATPVYLPVGAQSNVSLSTITGGGWTQCYSASMATAIGASGQNVLNACTGDYLMMAGRATGSDTFLSLAAALRSETIFDTGMNAGNTHVANGANWYYAANWSWGFTQLGDTVNLNQCDVSSSPLSMCLHTFDVFGGYRINDITGLNDSTAYEKVFFQANTGNPNAVPEPGSLALLGLSLVGLLAVRSRKR